MRALKLIVNVLLVIVALPVVIVGILGLALSPFQTVARATEPVEQLEVSDLMLSEAVKEQVVRSQDESQAFYSAGVNGVEANGTPWTEAAFTPDAVVEGAVAPAADVDLEAGFVPDTNAACEAHLAPEANVVHETDLASEVGVTYEAGLAPETGIVDEAGASSPVDVAPSAGYYSSGQLRTQGVIEDGGVKYTWYSQRVLPGGGLDIEGRHVSDDGYVVDAQERIVVASSELPYGTELNVPFGSGTAVVLDTGCPSGVVDVYTDF